MPRDLVARVNLDLLFPEFLIRILDLLAECRKRGADFYVLRGFSTYAEQDAIYAKGRAESGPRVTDAKAGQSAHNFGLAVDLCRDKDLRIPKLQPDWRDASYEILGVLAPQYGLVWGGHYKKPDRPHINFPGYCAAKQLVPIRRVFEAEGLKQAWRLIEVPPLYCLPEIRNVG
jgi:peptidoglycan LD-endopeptidase CwlK